jgi:AraC-like DNA-binding protein
MNANANLIETLANSPIYRDYERAFSEASGLPLALRPVETWKLPFNGKSKENRFCAIVGGKSRSCAACLQSQGKLCEDSMESASNATCAYGLCEAAVPIRLGSETIGFLQTGQVLRRKPSDAEIDHAAATAREMGVEASDETIRQAFCETPVVAPKRLEALTQLLSTFAEHLALRTNQLAVAEAHSEPPMITKAKEFIRQHYMEELSLGQVAKAVHASMFHFCKQFRKSAGVTFTEFVSRTRTEKAKDLLLNPNLRISEIAYEVGFQSLTHFNRVFKKIVGESPTTYRDRLPKGA